MKHNALTKLQPLPNLNQNRLSKRRVEHSSEGCFCTSSFKFDEYTFVCQVYHARNYKESYGQIKFYNGTEYEIVATLSWDKLTDNDGKSRPGKERCPHRVTRVGSDGKSTTSHPFDSYFESDEFRLTILIPDIVEQLKARKRKDKLLGQVVGVTGYSYREEYPSERITVNMIQQMIIDNGGFIGSQDIWQKDQIIVIGKNDFEEGYLRKSIEIGSRFNFTCNYMSQEAFLDFLEHGRYPSYFSGDPRVQEHEGLRFLATLEFDWPSIEVTHNNPEKTRSSISERWNEAHPLTSKYGYNVRKKANMKARREALRNAITPTELGLQKVAEHIAFLIRVNKQREDSLMDNAIDTWISDLEWLRETFYEGSVYTFDWPRQ